MNPENFLSHMSSAKDAIMYLVKEILPNHALIISFAITSSVLTWLSQPLPLIFRFILAGLAVFSSSYAIVVWWFLYRVVRLATHHCKNLGTDEIQVLQIFFLQNRRTTHLNIFYPPSASLLGKGLLVFTSSMIPSFNAPVVIPPYVYDFLKKNPQYINLKPANIGSEEYSDNSVWNSKP